MNNKFSFSRFAAVLKCDLMEHRWRYISAFFIMFVALSGFQLAQVNDYLLHSSRIEGIDFFNNYIDTVTIFFYFVLALALCCSASEISIAMKTKEKAMNYLMMPATNFEKFLSRVSIAIVGVFIMALVALILSDVVRILFLPIFDSEHVAEYCRFTFPQVISNLGAPFKAVFENGSTTNAVIVNDEVLTPVWSFGMCFMAVVCIVLSGLWSHSVFLLGGCIWRKGALLKTIASAMIISLLVLWLLVNIAPSIDVWAENRLAPWLEQRFETEEDLLRVGFPIVAFLNLAFVVFNWWLAYRLFSRKQMIPRTHLFGSNHPHHLFKKAHS